MSKLDTQTEDYIDGILEEFEDMSELDRAGPPLMNTRYEIFSVYAASGHSAANAYRAAYGIEKSKTVGNRPSKLMQRVEIRRRIAALCHQKTEMILARSILDERSVLDEYAWGIKNAREQVKFRDHKGYLDSVAKIMGLFADSDKKTDAATKSLEELKAEVSLLVKESGIAAKLPEEIPEDG